jgi:branched-subunit amino acid aminotransferase/4-amino-4-deoxychorismate lyase
MSESWAYLNGAWIPRAQLAINVEDAGFLLGTTVTEKLRTFRGSVFRLDEHLARMRRSLEIVGLDSGAIAGALAAAIPEFVQRHEGQIPAESDWSITAFATPGVGDGSRPTICVHGDPLPFERWAGQLEHGLPVVVSEIRQVPDNCWPSELKCRSRMHYYLADRAAAARQSGARAILLDQDGRVAEATSANVLVYRQHEGLSSPPDDHILVGISLGVVHELAGKLGVPFMRRRLTIEELQKADEVMLASTSVCLLPVVECDGQPIGEGVPGPMFKRLLAAWSKMVGVDIAGQARRFGIRGQA